jgi:hypothetical protein
MSFTSKALTARIGSEITVGKQALLTGEFSQQIRTLLQQYGVLVIPQGDKGIYKITLDQKKSETVVIASH